MEKQILTLFIVALLSILLLLGTRKQVLYARKACTVWLKLTHSFLYSGVGLEGGEMT